MFIKKNKNNIDISKPIGGPNRIAEIVDEYDEYSTNLPKPIHIEDIESSVIDLFTNGDFVLYIDGEQIPAIYMTNERWSDFSKTWEYVDGDKNLVPPFVLIKRDRIKKGTSYETMYNTPVKVYDYYKVPTFENGRYGYDIYKTPQPTQIDIEYEIMFISRYTEDTNVFMENILDNFNKMQYPVRVNGHFFRMERIDDFEFGGTMDDHEANRYNVITTKLILKAYTLNEKDFKVVKAINRVVNKINIK